MFYQKVPWLRYPFSFAQGVSCVSKEAPHRPKVMLVTCVYQLALHNTSSNVMGSNHGFAL